MSKHEREPRMSVDALVQAYLAKQTTGVDGAAGLARVRAGLGHPPTAAPARRRRRVRLALLAGLAAAVALAFFSGWLLSPARAGPRELVEAVKRVHGLPLARCYLVEMQRLGDDEERAPLSELAGKQVRVWTRGDRFWVEVSSPDAGGPPFIWGRGGNGALWAVLDAHRGVRVPLAQSPRPLQRLADLCTLNVETLLDDLLRDCTLQDEPDVASNLTRVLVAKPRSERTRLGLGRATLEIDSEARVLRRLQLVHNRRGNPQTRVTFTLLETRADDDAKYHLEGHLRPPFRIEEGNLTPRVKIELFARWQGVSVEGRGAKKDADPAKVSMPDVHGKTQTPLAQPDRQATVLFFLLPDCPISNAYAPEIRRVCADYAPKKVAAFVVHADPDVTAERAKTHAREYGLPCPVLLDPTHLLVKKTGVTMAPEVAVLGPDRKVLYRGRIDDWYADYGKRRGAPTQRDLRAALDAVLQGKAVAQPSTKVIGCFLPDPKK